MSIAETASRRAEKGEEWRSVMEASKSLRESLEKLARACRILEMEGHGDMSLGHLSWNFFSRKLDWLVETRLGGKPTLYV